MTAIYRNACDRPAPRKSTRYIRRVLLIAVVTFAALNILAAANPWLHRNDVVVACSRSMT